HPAVLAVAAVVARLRGLVVGAARRREEREEGHEERRGHHRAVLMPIIHQSHVGLRWSHKLLVVSNSLQPPPEPAGDRGPGGGSASAAWPCIELLLARSGVDDDLLL